MHAAARAVSGVGALGSALLCISLGRRDLKLLRIAIVRGQGLPRYTDECCIAMRVLQWPEESLYGRPVSNAQCLSVRCASAGRLEG